MGRDFMTKSLTNSELDHLFNFIGYGRLEADVWFIGMEEAGGGEDNLRKRLKFRQVEDCAEAHKILGITKHHWGKKTIQRTWWGMCYVMLSLEGKETDTESIRNYQAENLGRFNGSTLLCEMMPIPKHNVGSWGHEELIPQFDSREDYYRVVKPKRIRFLRYLLREHHPKIVICYGKKYWSDFQELFEGICFQSKGQFKVGKGHGMTVVLTDHFTSRTMNGKFDKVVKLISDPKY